MATALKIAAYGGHLHFARNTSSGIQRDVELSEYAATREILAAHGLPDCQVVQWETLNTGTVNLAPAAPGDYIWLAIHSSPGVKDDYITVAKTVAPLTTNYLYYWRPADGKLYIKIELIDPAQINRVTVNCAWISYWKNF